MKSYYSAYTATRSSLKDVRKYIMRESYRTHLTDLVEYMVTLTNILYRSGLPHSMPPHSS